MTPEPEPQPPTGRRPRRLRRWVIGVGGLLAVIGSFGLLRLPDFYQRMHPPTMGTTLGAGCVLIASMLVSSAAASRIAIHELLITALVVTTAPITAMLLARAALYRSSRRPRE